MLLKQASIDRSVAHAAKPDDPDPRVRWACRNGFNTRESYNDLKAILRLIQDWYILPQELRQDGEIDRGSFGSIFTGKFNDQPVAIKHVGCSGSGLSHPQVFRAMRLELSIASMLKHPNVVQFWGMSAFFPVNEEDDAKFSLGFVFELCDEGSLFQLIHRTTKLSQKGFLKKMIIAKDIACGMSYVHESNIVHRDLSTRNVLLADGMQVKIADFGCARQIVGKSYESTTISGSPAYMSPEQLQGRDLTLKVDVWALGVIMWELLNEDIPWSDRNCNDRKALAKHVAVAGGRLKKTPANKLTRDETARTAVQVIMDGAFQQLAETRYSMAKMHKLLEYMIADHKIAAAAMAENENRLLSLLERFYAKHNPLKVKEVPDLARLFQGKEHVLNDRLRKSYKVDLTNFEDTSSAHYSDKSADTGNKGQDSVQMSEHVVPDSNAIAERLLLFYLHLKPSKMKVVPLLLKKFEGDYHGLNEELQRKYSMDLNTPLGQMMNCSEGNGEDEGGLRSSLPVGALLREHLAIEDGGSGGSARPLEPPRKVLSRGTSAPPMQESPEKVMDPWQDEMQHLLKFFYLQLNPSKVYDVPRVLKAYSHDAAGLNASLRKAYGIDLSASRQDIVKEKLEREHKAEEVESIARVASTKAKEAKLHAQRLAREETKRNADAVAAQAAEVHRATASEKLNKTQEPNGAAGVSNKDTDAEAVPAAASSSNDSSKDAATVRACAFANCLRSQATLWARSSEAMRVNWTESESG